MRIVDPRLLVTVVAWLFSAGASQAQEPAPGSYALKADSGRYLARCNGCVPGGAYPDNAGVHETNPGASWARWTLEKRPSGRFALKSDAGRYLARCNGCGRGAYPDSAFVHETNPDAPWAQWTPERRPNGRWVLKSDTGRYLARCNGCFSGAAVADTAFVHEANPDAPWAQWTLESAGGTTQAPAPAAAAPVVYALKDLPTSSWMTAGAATLGPMALNRTAIPGAHDAGTYAIDTSFTSWTTQDLAPDVSDSDRATKWHGTNLGVTAGWAKTQTRTMTQMLADGIRYFDIRVCVDAKGNLRTCHTLYGAPLSEMLSAVKTFTEANPKEIVFLGFTHFWDESYPGVRSGTEGLTDANWAALRTLVKGTLSGKLVSRAKYSPTSTFNQLWNGKATDGSTNQVIALFARSVSSSFKTADPLFWQEGATPDSTVAPEAGGTWVSKTDIDEFKTATAAVVASQASGSYASVFWAIRTIVTPDTKVITRGFAGGPFPKTVLQLANQTNSVVIAWIKNEWSGYGKGNINFIWADGYESSELVKLAFWLNKLIPQDTRFTADGGTTTPVRTSWYNWNCPTGYRDDGLTCLKPEPKTRGAGYPWKLGDKVGSLDEARARCVRDNPQGCEKAGEIIYPLCPSGYKSFGSNICTPTCPTGMGDGGIFCTKLAGTDATSSTSSATSTLTSYTRPVGTPLVCPSGKVQSGALCYDACSSGYTLVAGVCWQQCPAGYPDAGATCGKPAAYGRGAGYPWKIGDTVGSLDEARARCTKANPQGCEKSGEIIYPKCRAGFRAIGSNICSPVCPAGMTDAGAFCTKRTETRAPTPLSACPSGKVNENQLCYEPCKTGYTGIGTTCKPFN